MSTMATIDSGYSAAEARRAVRREKRERTTSRGEEESRKPAPE